MYFDNWDIDSCLVAMSGQELGRTTPYFEAAIKAIANKVNGLVALDIENYLDFMCPWFFSYNEGLARPLPEPKMRNRSVAVMSGCALAVEAIMRCLGITCVDPSENTDILRRFYEYNLSKNRYGAIHEVIYVAKAAPMDAAIIAASPATKSATKNSTHSTGAAFRPSELVNTANFLQVGDVIIVEDPEHAFTIVDSPIEVDTSSYVSFTMKALHGGRKENNKQKIELDDTELRLVDDKLTYEHLGAHRQVDYILRLASIPRRLQALLPNDWREQLPPEPVVIEQAPTEPPAQGSLAQRYMDLGKGQPPQRLSEFTGSGVTMVQIGEDTYDIKKSMWSS